MQPSPSKRLVTALGRGTRAFDTPSRRDLSWTRRLIAALARYADTDLAMRPTSRHSNSEAPPGLSRAIDDTGESTLRDQVRGLIAALQGTTPDQLLTDADGDVGLRAGTAMVFAKVRDNPPVIDVISPVLTEVQPSEELFRRLSELTSRISIGRLFLIGGTVWASVPVFGRDFQANHLVAAVQAMTRLADGVGDQLQGEFGGRQFHAGKETGQAWLWRRETEAATPTMPLDATKTDAVARPTPSSAERPAPEPLQTTSKLTTARPAVLYQGKNITVTTSYVDSDGHRFPLSELEQIERVESGGLLQSRLYELWAWFHGKQVRLFSSQNAAEFGQVARAIARAREYTGHP